jgi:hypothetical protein
MKSIPKLVNPSNIKMFIPLGFPYGETYFRSQISSDLLTSSLPIEIVAELLKIEIHTLRNKISDGINFPPHFKFNGGRVRYFPIVWFDLYLGL